MNNRPIEKPDPFQDIFNEESRFKSFQDVPRKEGMSREKRRLRDRFNKEASKRLQLYRIKCIRHNIKPDSKMIQELATWSKSQIEKFNSTR